MLVALAAAVSSACYEPEAIDCTISCVGRDECADGQVCGSDGFCAAPDVAGLCRGGELGDPQPALVTVEIEIEGDGKVSLDGVGSCDTRMANPRPCRFSVTRDQPLQLKAHDTDDREFVAWTQTCAGETAICVFTPVMQLTRVGALFD